MASQREVKESPVDQGTVDGRVYSFEWELNGTPTSPVVTLFDLKAGADVTSTKLTGAASVSGTKVLTPKVSGLAAGSEYRLTCQVTIDGNALSAFCIIEAEA